MTPTPPLTPEELKAARESLRSDGHYLCESSFVHERALHMRTKDELSKAIVSKEISDNYRDRAETAERELKTARERARVRSMSYGDLPEQIRVMIQPHEWDNKNPCEQRDWAISQLAALSSAWVEVLREHVYLERRGLTVECECGWISEAFRYVADEKEAVVAHLKSKVEESLK